MHAATDRARGDSPFVCLTKGQGPGMVNDLLAATPATRSRPRPIKGQEPGLVNVLLQPSEQTRSRGRKAARS